MAGWLDWANLLLRWFHFTAGIAWIGSSFYFVWLDAALTAPAPARPGVEGELWMVHSGGFYQVEKRLIGPGAMPAVLHWFKWEAMLTWASGIVLLAVAYYLTGGVYLVDPAVSGITPGRATLLSVVLLAASWLIYDGLWRSPLGRAGWPATALSFLLLGGAIWFLCDTLSGRAAFVHVGAILGTIMVANVWVRILPAQQQMIDATARGAQPDFALGRAAKRRSMHNSYVTLPVLFIMLSNHYPAAFGHPLRWLVLALFIVAGAAARHVMIGKTRRARLVALVPAVGALAAVVAMTAAGGGGGERRRGEAAGAGGGERRRGEAGTAAEFAAARDVINRRCLPCHSAFPTDSLFTVAPLGITFDSPEQIQRLAGRIRERAVVQRTMPLANRTGMTDEEREVIARWAGP